MSRPLTRAWSGAALCLALVLAGVWIVQTPVNLYYDEFGDLAAPCSGALATPIQYGPLYRVFLCGLRVLIRDTLTVLYVKQLGLILAIPALMFALARRLDVSGPVAAGIALWFVLMLLDHNGTSETAFALAVAGCLCVARWPWRGWAGFFVLMAAAFLVRTEYVLGLLAGLAVLVWRVWVARNGAPGQRPVGSLAVGAACLALCVAAYLLGPQPAGTDRTWVAFSQHFALNRQQADGAPGDPWLEWRRFVEPVFPSSHSLGDAVRENPGQVAWHVAYNLVRRLPGRLIVRPVPPPLLSGSPARDAALGVPALAGILVLAGVAVRRGLWRDERLLAPLALAAIPWFSLLILPWPRHLLPFLPLLAVLAGRGCDALLRERRGLWRAVPAALAGALALGAAASLAVMAPGVLAPQPSGVAMVSRVREQAAADVPRILSSFQPAGERLCALAGVAPCEGVSWSAGELPSAAARRSGANLILVGPEWRQHTEVQSDAAMLALLREPQRHGCRADPPTHEGFQLIRCSPAVR